MSVSGKIRNFGHRFADSVVNVVSGRTRIESLEGSKAFISILVVGVISLGAGGWIIWQTIQSVQTPLDVNNVNITNTTAIAELAKLKNKDTDGDGLSDYDELFVTHTSPYLSDSDSDGISDKAELLAGTDPNCPSGKSCGGTIGQTSNTNSGGLTPDFLRQALLASGVPKTTLDATPDDQLLAIYQQVVSQSSTVADLNLNINSEPTVSDLQGLSGADIRKLLTDSGVDPTTLNQVDDATLLQIFQQSLQQ